MAWFSYLFINIKNIEVFIEGIEKKKKKTTEKLSWERG